MYCQICGGEIPDDSSFCALCGNRVAAAPAAPAAAFLDPQPSPPPRPPAKRSRADLAVYALVALLVAAGAALLLVLLTRSPDEDKVNGGASGGTQAGGTGTGQPLSLDEYGDKVTPILDDFSDKYLTADFSGIDIADMSDQNVQQMIALEKQLQSGYSGLMGDYQEMRAIAPPDAAEAVQEDLLAFYLEAMGTAGEVEEAATYLYMMGRSALVMEAKMQNVMARFDSVQTYDQLVPLTEDSYEAWNTHLTDLQALRPPPSLLPYHQQLVKAAQDLVGIYAQLRTASINQDSSAADSIAQQAQAVGDTYDNNLLGSLSEFSKLQGEFNALKGELRALKDRVADLSS